MAIDGKLMKSMPPALRTLSLTRPKPTSIARTTGAFDDAGSLASDVTSRSFELEAVDMEVLRLESGFRDEAAIDGAYEVEAVAVEHRRTWRSQVRVSKFARA